MRALTLWQPWASAMVRDEDPKNVENRTTLLPPRNLIGRYIAIHAGKQYDPNPAAIAAGLPPVSEPAWRFPPGSLVPAREDVPFGAILGLVRVVGALDARKHEPRGLFAQELRGDALKIADLRDAPWWLGPIGWLVDDPRRLPTPVPCRGALGVWTVPEDVRQLVVAQLKEEWATRFPVIKL